MEIPVEDIKLFVKRSRPKPEFEQMKASMRVHGLKLPIQVRSITNLPADKRRRPDGGTYRWQLVYGQGRLTAAKQLKWERIPATVTDAPEGEIIGRFLAENLIRDPLPWAQKAQLVKKDLDAGMSVEAVAKKYLIGEKHVLRFQRILSKTAPGLDEEVAALPLSDAEALTTIPPGDQAIVMELMRELDTKEVRALVRKAEQVREEKGDLSPKALKSSLTRVLEDLQHMRDKMKVLRLHHSLGPMNLVTLLKDSAFRKALEAAGVNLRKFEEVVS